jgi:hypothetical protein
MAQKDLEADDPFEINGVEMPGQTEAELRDMVLCIAEEFVREGWSEEKLLEMFKNPFYQGPYLAWKQKGDEYVLAIICEAIKMWRPHASGQSGGVKK